MLGYYRKQILSLKLKINSLHDDRDDLDLLKEIQLSLLEKIIHSEKKIINHKSRKAELKKLLRQKGNTKVSAGKIKKKIDFTEQRIKQFRWLIYVWKALGDALAYIYIDKWNLKSLTYNVDNPDIKESSGYLYEKQGLKGELSFLNEAISYGVPAVLTDLTNSIRYGDICLLGGSIPFLIEVKSSRNINSRTERQKQNLEILHNYLYTDQAENYRGMPNVTRVDMQQNEVAYLENINSLMDTSIENGYAFERPEESVIYFVSFGCVATKEILSEVFFGVSQPQVFFINSAKKESLWMNYYPFTLTIRDPEHLYAFLAGDLTIVVIIDVAKLKELALERNCELALIKDNEEYGWEISMEIPGYSEQIKYRLSHHLIERIAFEFISPTWILDNSNATIKMILKEKF